MRQKALVCLTASWMAVAPSFAQGYEGGAVIILSDKFGRGMTVGAQMDGRTDLVPIDLSGKQIADEFKTLCLDTHLDSGALLAAAGQSRLGLAKTKLTLPPIKNVPGFEYEFLSSGSARAGIWTGDDAALKGRPIQIRDRGALVQSGYGPFKAQGRQCNLDLKVSGIEKAEELVARLSEHIGKQPAKLVMKASFADGNWEFTSASGTPLRVSFAMVDMNKPRQLVHIVLQEVVGKGS